MASNSWNKLVLLLWKNWIIQWNKKIQLVLEVVMPVVYSLILVIFRTSVIPTNVDTVLYEPVNINNLDILREQLSTQIIETNITWELAYSPQNNYLESVIKAAAASLSSPNLLGLTIKSSSQPNASSLQKYLVTNEVFAGIQFDDSLSGIVDYPKELSYSLRFPSELRTSTDLVSQTWKTNQLFPVFDIGGPRNMDDQDGGLPPGYIQEGFIPVQHAIASAFIKLVATSLGRDYTNPPDVVMQRYPYPGYLEDHMLQGLTIWLPLIILLSFLYACIFTVKSLTVEKEKQLKEVMKIMGLDNWIHWTAWFINTFIMFTISTICIVIILKVPWSNGAAVLTNTNWFTLLVFLLIYAITAITFGFMVSTFFTRASTAASVTALFWFLTYLPFGLTEANYSGLSFSSKMGCSIFSNTAMGYAFMLIVQYEALGEGLQWSNLFQPVSVDDSLTVGYMLVMMIVDSIIMMLICLYFEQILPGGYGVPKKWYFPLTKSFWCSDPIHGDLENGNKATNSNGFEAEPVGKKIGIKVRNLRKVFSGKVAVNGVSMNIFEDQITVLLGHNGAGKTTTISMLTGMFPPTSGTAIINGCDIRTNIEGARLSLGICPQHNVLFDELTVRQHIIFFSRLRGLKGPKIDEEVEKYVRILQLENKIDSPSATLSGGMKRKLSVGVALCGGTKVVLCDEPSSGMDPSARRQLWDLLQAEKKNRTILLTTHFMDEADVLGDRIAIMCDGVLKCCGSSFYLKKTYGSGYILICVKKDKCKSDAITQVLRKYIPTLKIESEIGSELSYHLSEEYSSVFEEMLTELEQKSDELDLNGYGVAITSMEDVFMKVGAEWNSKSESGTSYNKLAFSNIFTPNQVPLHRGFRIMLNQWKAMFYKKYLFTIRNLIMLVIQILVPIIFVTITIIICNTQGTFLPLKPLEISLNSYNDAVVILETASNVTANTIEAKIAEQYAGLISADYKFETISESFQDYVLDLAKTILVRINSKYLAAVTISQGHIIAWLNNQPLHTAPLTLNLVHNAMAKAYLGPAYNIHVINQPLPYTTQTRLQQLSTGNNLGTQLSSNLCFCMSFISSIYVLFIIKERESRAKLLQYVGGVPVFTFWIIQFIWDMFTYLITTLIVILTIACFQEDGYSSFDELGKTYVLFILFGLSALPWTYLLSKWFSEPAAGFARISLINVIVGLVFFIVISVLNSPFYNTTDIANSLEWVFLIFPHFCLAQSLQSLNQNIIRRDVCLEMCDLIPECFNEEIMCALKSDCCSVPYFGWEKPGVLREIIYMAATFFIFFLLLLNRENNFIAELFYRMQRKWGNLEPPKTLDRNVDDDVASEKKSILQMSKYEIEYHNLVLDRVSKYYDQYLAVNQISVCVRHTECFGLLGVNGAGKTTTFKMLTGDERISSGDAFVKGLNLKTDMKGVCKEIGYCPQFDALLEDLTGREMILMFCLIRGVPDQVVPMITSELAMAFGFQKHINKPTRAYSGGNKRKLSTAISLIGNPSVVYLDEPTTGMDPAARRQLWDVVCKVRDSGKSIVLTSHSMEECEALCTRLAIMVNGEFKCIGSTQHLKNKFSKGLVLKIKLKRNEGNETLQAQQMARDIENAKKFVKREFSEAQLKEEYQGILTFHIPLTSIKWSQIFGLMERNREDLNIEDYSICQTTLEEIFLEFAKHQMEDDTRGTAASKSCFKCK